MIFLQTNKQTNNALVLSDYTSGGGEGSDKMSGDALFFKARSDE